VGLSSPAVVLAAVVHVSQLLRQEIEQFSKAAVLLTAAAVPQVHLLIVGGRTRRWATAENQR
jgi:hypothetical protein